MTVNSLPIWTSGHSKPRARPEQTLRHEGPLQADQALKQPRRDNAEGCGISHMECPQSQHRPNLPRHRRPPSRNTICGTPSVEDESNAW